MCDRSKTEQRQPRSLADIVRKKTNNGDTIVQFYLDVANGKLDDEGLEACHRRDTAKQIHMIAPELVADAIARLAGVQCVHAERRTKSPTTVVPATAGTHPRPDANGHNSTAARHAALEYLASALAAPSLAAAPRVAGIVRESTDHGKTVVSFLMHVMHGVVRGFRPRHRVQAAKELLGHIARDELARTDSLRITVIPAEAGIQGGRDGDGVPSSRERRQDASTSPQPSPAPDADEPSFPSSREPIPSSVPADADEPSFPSSREPIPSSVPADADEPSFPSSRGPIPSSAPADADGSPFPSSREPIPSSGTADTDGSSFPSSREPNPDSQRGCYDIDRKIADAQRDPSHPIHKFVQAYDKVAAAFHGEEEDVRYWISGEVPDSYGQVHLGVRPSTSPVAPKTTPVQARPPLPRTWDHGQGREHLDTAAHRQAAPGRRPQTQPVQNLGLNPPRRPIGPSGANTLPANSDRWGGFQTRPAAQPGRAGPTRCQPTQIVGAGFKPALLPSRAERGQHHTLGIKTARPT